jgi:hypothetical protein
MINRSASLPSGSARNAYSAGVAQSSPKWRGFVQKTRALYAGGLHHHIKMAAK